MGLLDFASNIGASLFTSEEEAGQKIVEHINKQNPGIENLQVSVKDGVANITGAAKDQAAAEKAILMIGNVRGVKQVNFDIAQLVTPASASTDAATATAVKDTAAAPTTDTPAAAATTASQIEVEFYEIKSGDSLSAIAKKFYGDGNRYNEIFEANKEVIGHPDKIYPGQKIRIPQDGGF